MPPELWKKLYSALFDAYKHGGEITDEEMITIIQALTEFEKGK
jgi:hypothetical protein